MDVNANAPANTSPATTGVAPVAGAAAAPPPKAAADATADKHVATAQPAKASAMPAVDLTKGWSFKNGQAFSVDGPLMYDGNGRTVENSPTRLVFDWNQKVPKAHDPGPEVPRDGQLHIRWDIQVNSQTGQATLVTTNRDAANDPKLPGGGRVLNHDAVAKIKQNADTGKTRVDYVGQDGRHSIEFDRSGHVELDGYDHMTKPE